MNEVKQQYQQMRSGPETVGGRTAEQYVFYVEKSCKNCCHWVAHTNRKSQKGRCRMDDIVTQRDYVCEKHL